MRLRKIRILDLSHKIPTPLMDCEDILCWTAAANGKFSVKSGYDIIIEEEHSGEEVWGLIWKANLHERFKLFLWRLASNVLPLNSLLSSRMEVWCPLHCQSGAQLGGPLWVGFLSYFQLLFWTFYPTRGPGVLLCCKLPVWLAFFVLYKATFSTKK